MVLKREEYKALEDVVGPENISEDPVILDSYSFIGGDFKPVRPEAVLLPGSVEDVQAIIKICNRYHIKVKCHSTGWSPSALVSSPRTILLDLRRMNRIIEINEDAMYAIVEPYVIAAELQAEAMKKGLSCVIIGAGASCSVVAYTTCYHGESPFGVFMGRGCENLLAAEWVLPNGEIVRTGSLGSGCGWFCGEGPGPSVRGLLRGVWGTHGSFGVVTKIAVKLHPWPGPEKLEVTGSLPIYRLKLPENVDVHTIAFPSFEAMLMSAYRIWDAKIGYIVHRQFNFFGEELEAAIIKILLDPNKTIYHLEEVLKDPETKRLTEKMRKSYQIILVGNTKKHLEWQNAALKKILEETGGWIVEECEDQAIKELTFIWLFRLCYKNWNYYAGGYTPGYSPYGSPLSLLPIFEESLRHKKELIEKKLIVDDGVDALMGTFAIRGGGGAMYMENFCLFDVSDPESKNAAIKYRIRGEEVGRKMGYIGGMGGPIDVFLMPTKEEKERILKECTHPEAWRWQSKFKRAFDPNNVA
ncbi:MAG: FAD-binding oxidoreductase, partial [Candidatus Bathyarchaeia archaeon]